MLGGGFSMLFLYAFTGFGAIVLALGLMTMALIIQMRAKAVDEAKYPTPYESRVSTPTKLIASPRETIETQTKPTFDPAPERAQTEEKTDEPLESEPTEPQTDQVQPSQPPQPQVPIEQKTEPTSPEEKPKEEPQVVTVPAN
jgi:outer membrane biosynthesis protein TonB